MEKYLTDHQKPIFHPTSVCVLRSSSAEVSAPFMYPCGPDLIPYHFAVERGTRQIAVIFTG